ncbi:hypothetical protein [Microbacterium sp. EST19A]|uniref:hypothetical protein n=1 Tax=Microbacterium sp. EST19A TaxID=2862681 RepID=UPI001CC00118|nr:hypothetical protein [Microbacterium sp. EST19A]
MPAATDPDELRALQRKAYGRDGALTDAEARRLRDLERAGQEETVAPSEAPPVEIGIVDAVPFDIDRRRGAPVDVPVPGASTGSGTRESGSDGVRIPDSGAEESGTPRSRTASRLLRRWWVPAAASALLLAIGVGAGWVFFGQPAGTVVLTTDQQERRTELYQEGDYDAGSLLAVGQDEDAVAWYATKDGGEQACLVIDIAQASSEACQDAADTRPFGLSASVMVPPNAGSDAESGVAPGASVNAYLMLSTTGEPMVSIQRWSPDLAMISQFRGAERDRATALISEGFNAGLLIVGEFQSEPVWLGTRFSEGDSFVEYCMIVDGVDGRTVCSADIDAAGRGVSTDVEGTADGVPTTWNLRVQNTQDRTPYLTIAQTVSFPNPGDRVTLGGDDGDPLEETVPSEPPG